MYIGPTFDKDVRRVARAAILLACVLVVAAFLLGRCSAGYVVKVELTKEASDGN